MEVKVNAVVLKAADYGENDKILTLLTAEQGKLSAGIKGVKKAGAKLKFAAQPFCFAEYILAKRGDRYTVTGCTETESFYDLRTDVCKFYAASAAVEVAMALTYEGDGQGDMFYSLVRALTRMCGGDERLALVNFLLSSLKKSGYEINLENCPRCGKPLIGVQNLKFDMAAGSFMCAECGEGAGASLVTYNVMRKASGKSHKQDFITSDGEKRALRLMREYFLYKTDSRFPALTEYIKMI